jgi:hypothetical protein
LKESRFSGSCSQHSTCNSNRMYIRCMSMCVLQELRCVLHAVSVFGYQHSTLLTIKP